MLQKTVTTETRDPLGMNAEMEKHRETAMNDLGYVELVTTSNSSRPDPDDANQHIYTITSTWKQAAPPVPADG